MRKLISGAAALLALSAGTAFADDNTVTTRQTSLVTSSNITVEQVGQNSSATVLQVGQGSLLEATILQQGIGNSLGNDATIIQQGDISRARASIEQEFTTFGAPNLAQIRQRDLGGDRPGDEGSEARIVQQGGDNRGSIEQFSDPAAPVSSFTNAVISQTGEGNLANVRQTGFDVGASVVQIGLDNSVTIAQGFDAAQDFLLRVSVDQRGVNNFANLEQNGIDNYQIVTQR